MKKMPRKTIKAFCISTVLAGIIFSGNVFATELELQTTKEFEDWTKLSTEEKQQTMMPQTNIPVVPDEYFEEEANEIPSILNSLIGSYKLETNENALKNVENKIGTMASAGPDSNAATFNLANRLKMRVEHQGSTTECWAFSLLKSMETNVALRSGVTELPDFSERHMDYATSKTFTDGINPNAFEREVGSGGLPVAGLAYLVNGQGAVLEEDMPFEDNEKKISLSEIDKEVDTVVTEYVNLPALYKYYTKDARGNTTKVTYHNGYGSTYKDEEVKIIRDEIKKHIVQYGAIASLTAGNQTKYYNNANISRAYAYNCNDSSMKRDHGITIVGWDDNYSKDNFAEGAKPSTNGAYIVLNSYGTQNFDQGYLYISYEDVLIENELHGITSTTKKDYDIAYQSDFYGGIFTIGTNDTDTGYYANTYERDASKVEILTDVGVTVADYVNLEIYVNPIDGTLDFGKLIKVAESENTLAPGYSRIEIEPIELQGSEFAVVVKQKSLNDVFHFSVEAPYKGTAYACVTSDNNSYYSTDGEDWINIKNMKTVENPNGDGDIKVSGIDVEESDVCIKAFTTLEKEVPPPTENPEDNPSDNPSDNPTDNPSDDPTDNPTDNPSDKPTDGDDDQKDDEEKEIYISSKVYLIKDQDIFKIPDGTNLSTFKGNITSNSSLTVLNGDKEITGNSEKIKTGMKLKLENGKEYELIVRGDINCDSKVSLTDLSKLILHYNEKKGFILTGSALKAADLSCDGKVSLVDVSQMLVLYNSK